MAFRFHKTIRNRPRRIRDGEMFYAMPRRLAERRAEEALIASFISDRRLFGMVYECLNPDFYWEMPADSGVFISALVRTVDILPHAERPGDIDLLIVPYEGDTLILDHVLAIEAKAVRATFSRPGKSPNEFGFSQAKSLLDLGFPYVAVAHLIISDVSPEETWREMTVAEVIDASGQVRILGSQRVDPLPGILMERAFGRLVKNCIFEHVGLISAYMSPSIFDDVGTSPRTKHFPSGRRASPNPAVLKSTLAAVAAYFERHPARFLDTPKFPPVD